MQDEVFSYQSPFGLISYAWNGEHCARLWLADPPPGFPAANDPVRHWLDAYFAGEDSPLPPLAAPHTPFQQKMRAGALAIPRGTTLSYGELAARLGTAPRALGQALGANPLPLLIPCHRIVAAHGLGGFACGLDWKRRLLAFESGKTRPGASKK